MTDNNPKDLGKLPQGNIFSDIPDYTKAVHVRENNQESENHLNENRQKFTGQVAIVVSLLQKGVVLSSYTAMTKHHIGHLPRRIKDARDNLGIHIDEQFEMDSNGKATRNKIWFIREAISESTAIKYKIEWKKKH